MKIIHNWDDEGFTFTTAGANGSFWAPNSRYHYYYYSVDGITLAQLRIAPGNIVWTTSTDAVVYR